MFSLAQGLYKTFVLTINPPEAVDLIGRGAEWS